ncbi:hypothetical protein BJY00DRAFT_318425 [Aspergillus carlsbadensis]|nr:hypothetical protein BJY00DRAFT_318425 [Aspergillus carlsbadensis]
MSYVYRCASRTNTTLSFSLGAFVHRRRIFESRCLHEEYEICCEKMNTEHFHRLFISLGYASRGMPVLKSLSFGLASGPRTNLTFTTARGVIQVTSTPSSTRPLLTFRSGSAYRPARRVADAWGFRLDDMGVVDEGPWEDYSFIVCSVTLDRLGLSG